MKNLHNSFGLLALFLALILTLNMQGVLYASPFEEDTNIKTLSVSSSGTAADSSDAKVALSDADLQSYKQIIDSASGNSDAKTVSANLGKIYEELLAKGCSSDAQLWVTDPISGYYLQKQTETPVFSDYSYDCPEINVDEKTSFQSMDGFGFALTGGSAWLLSKMDKTARTDLLKKFFDTKEGIGVSMVRISIGASDLSRNCFSYDEALIRDKDLSKFNIMNGDKEVIPMLKEILAISPSIKVLATPWSAPRWMKTLRFYRGQSLQKKYYSVYADYFVKYVKCMKENGISIYAVTPQNEPENGSNAPSMKMDAESQVEFIGKHLGPALKKAGFDDVQIFCWDHNCDNTAYPLTVLGDSDANTYTDGVAWHLYAGDISALSEVHNKYPDKKMYLTEQWTGRDGTFDGDLKWHMQNVLIGTVRNWGQAVFQWNLASDPDCKPHTVGGCPDCKGAVTIDSKGNTTLNVSYYVIGHASKFVQPDSVRIFSDSTDSGLENAAFKTNDGSIALVVLNNSDSAKYFRIKNNGKYLVTWLNAGAAGTFVWLP